MVLEMHMVSERLQRLSASQTLVMAQKSRELKAKGVDVISLSLGEPDFNTPDHIKEAAKQAIDNNCTFYPPVEGYEILRQAISNKFKRENNLNYRPDEIMVSNGAKQCIANAILSLVNYDDEVILPTPYWVSYVELVKLARGHSVLVNATIENNFKVTPQQIERAITSNTKVFLFSSPCNPTGTAYTHDELKAIAAVFERNPHVFVISDEIYEHINFVGRHESIAQFESLRDRVIVINGVSKGYAMTGWRIGYLAGPKWIVQACTKLQGQYTSGACTIAQKASVAALNTEYKALEDMCHIFKRRRDLLLSLLADVPGLKCNVPEGAFYIFPEASYYLGKTDGATMIETTDDLALYLLNKAHVAIVGGTAFGAPDYIRFSYATSDDKLVEAVRRIKIALAELH